MWFIFWLQRSRQSNRAAAGVKQSARRPARYRPRIEVLEGRCLPSTLTVLNTGDSGAGSLRDTVAAAQSGDTIVFDPSLAGQTISLTSGELIINKSLDIEGPGGTNAVSVSGVPNSRIFDITDPSTTVTLANLFISAGSATQGAGIFDAGATVNLVRDNISYCLALGVAGAPGGPNGDGLGGAIYQGGGNLTLTACTLFSDVADGGGQSPGGQPLAPVGGAGMGGDIFSAGGVLTVVNCNFNGFAAGGGGLVGGTAAGGAIYAAAGTTVTISNSIVSTFALGGDGTVARGETFGGAIYQAGGSLTITGTQLLGSEDSTGAYGASGGLEAGGALYIAGGNVSLVNSSIQTSSGDLGGGNVHAALGGVVYQAGGFLSAINCTFTSSGAANFAFLAEGGALYVAAGTTTIQNCAFNNNSVFGLVAFGGAIYQAGGTLTVTNSTFASDTAQATGLAGGGALYVAGGTATIQKCAFDYDSALGFFGGEGLGGAIFVAPDGSITISKNSSFVGDTASTAGNTIYFGP
jgi:hypothetical protein